MTVAVVVVLVVSVVLIAMISSSVHSMHQAWRDALDLESTGPDYGSSAVEYLDHADELDDSASLNRSVTPGWLKAVTFGQAGNDNDQIAKRLAHEARDYRRVAEDRG